MMAKIDTKRTMMMRLRFSSKYRGVFLKSMDVYSNIIFACDCCVCLGPAQFYCKVKQINFLYNMAGWNIFLKMRVCARYACAQINVLYMAVNLKIITKFA